MEQSLLYGLAIDGMLENTQSVESLFAELEHDRNFCTGGRVSINCLEAPWC